MASRTIPKSPKLIPLGEIPKDPVFHGLRVVHYQTDDKAAEAFEARQYEFQHRSAELHEIRGVTVALQGAADGYRLTASIHCTLREFVEYVKYDPSNPPPEDYDALHMAEAHRQTQSDFKSAKARNLGDFKQYNLEAIRGERIAFLPAVSGWQTTKVFSETVFVALDEQPMKLYGVLFLPKKPIMQADGQTQTAALFQTAHSGLAIQAGSLDGFGVSLELELNVDPARAAQSFADRNGRGTNKSKNLIALYDSAAALSQLRERAVKGTIFEERLSTGQGAGTSETQTENIVDLSTMEQMLLGVISGGSAKPEHVKHYHLDTLVPHCKAFLELLDHTFGSKWPHPTPDGADPFRRTYVHGWPFALKALALAYHDVNITDLGPYSAAMAATLKDEHATAQEAVAAFQKAVAEKKKSWTEAAPITEAEFKKRLQKIDWKRYRKHWVTITGAKTDNKGRFKVRTLKDGSEVVDAQAQNTAAVINSVRNRILGEEWEALATQENEALPKRRAS
jgi:hypothetical protein